ncbi:hypothetical protein TIFTF001_041137 [Ficus carica]|uniref:Uncharacterized protein n=1 Tax=Ficus carica TaxID=3494 RepID=A0AA88CSS4_FICCA|nr:hypothetical protein TIFTF001_041137 [Ficus carica]
MARLVLPCKSSGLVRTSLFGLIFSSPVITDSLIMIIGLILNLQLQPTRRVGFVENSAKRIVKYQRFQSTVLNAGEELQRETLPLRMGSRLYQLQGLKSFTWYEVKISYPSCIPASFSLELKRDKSDLTLHMNRRLLNTEKIIFKTVSLDFSDQGRMYVLVSVEPEGFVAIPNVPEQEFILFNIACDELLLGIPYKAWWVVVLGRMYVLVSVEPEGFVAIPNVLELEFIL